MKPRGSPNHPRRLFGRPRVPQTASGVVLGGSWGSPGALLSAPGRSWAPLGDLLGCLGRSFGAFDGKRLSKPMAVAFVDPKDERTYVNKLAPW